MKMFQYKMLENKLFKKTIINDENINRLGKQGWELVSLYNDSGITKAYFKKEL